jgi:predicted NodU family carbamoyl transferase
MSGYILGVQKHHNSSVCLLNKGDIVYFNKEEKLTNKYESPGFPIKCLEEVKKITLDIDMLGITGYNFSEDDYLWVLFLKNMGFKIKKLINFYKPHHISHLFKSFPDSKFQDALVIVWDGRGSSYTLSNGSHVYETTSVFSITNNHYECIYKRLQASKEEDTNYEVKHNDFYPLNPHINLWLINSKTHIDIKTNIDIGRLYSECARLIGLRDKECGKVMHLSTLGSVDSTIPSLTETENGLIYIDKNICDYNLNFKLSNLEIVKKNPNNFFHHIQKAVEQIGVNFVKTMLDKTKHKNLVLCGGVAYNSLLNNKIIETFPDINVFVDPICGDEGNSIGVARMCAFNT